ncbi:MAG: diaminopimelate decarboxylase [Thermoleophilia bacterium]|nr:diaminopimelate decarboxylase [Thermoleophilia bacterium]
MSLLTEIADEVGTPLYVYDADIFRDRIATLRGALAGVAHRIHYAAKANDALALLRIAGDEGLGADIVSGGELHRCLAAGIPADRILFSGVGKQPLEIRAAIEAGVHSLNVESLGELEATAREARAASRVAPVSVRLNPDVEVDTHEKIATGSATTKFGLTFDDALVALTRAAADTWLEPLGISFHLGSQLFDLAPLAKAGERAAELWAAASDRGIRLRELDVGGGLGVAYETGEEVDVEAYAAVATKAAARVDATLLLEPGRWLVGPAGAFLTRVLYVKDAADRRIAICDGGMNDLIRPTLYDAYHPIAVLGADERPIGAVDVVGPVCETGDFFARGRELPLPEPGDLLAIGYAGAYGRVMGSAYNARPPCAEVLVEQGEWRVIREAGTLDDLVRGELL